MGDPTDSDGRDYLACKAAVRHAAGCINRARVRRSRLEAAVLEAPGSRRMQPALVAEFVAAFTAEWNRLAAEASAGMEAKRRALAAVRRTLTGLIGAIADGLPKTKTFKVPFRMEMSGFARHEGSLAIIGDLGMVWPLIASRAAQRLGVQLQFMSYPQQTEAGRKMRETIVNEIRPFSRRKMLEALRERNTVKAHT